MAYLANLKVAHGNIRPSNLLLCILVKMSVDWDHVGTGGETGLEFPGCYLRSFELHMPMTNVTVLTPGADYIRD